MKHHTGLATSVDLQHANANMKRETDTMFFFGKKGKKKTIYSSDCEAIFYLAGKEKK
jgi:hypothetical protein